MVKLTHGEQGIRYLDLANNKDANVLDNNFLDELTVLVESLKHDREAKAVILVGSKDVFCSGGSAEFLQQLSHSYSTHVEHDYANKVKVLLDIPVPVIAAMEGSANGGGLTIALYADILIAAQESRYGFSFMNMGFTPGMGTTALSVEAFGSYLAMELMFSGDTIKGRDLIGKSNMNYILPKNEVLAKADAIALAICEKSRLTLELLKKYSSVRKRKLLEETSTVEAFMHKIAFSQPEINQLMQKNFLG